MDLSSFNQLPAAAAFDAVRPCADVPAWIETVVTGRPYETVADLLALAEAAAASWTPADVDAALAHHPRIGEQSVGDDIEAGLSRSEQSTVTGQDAAIAAGNRAYEAKFDRIFLIRAAGRSANDVLDQLTARLDNDPATEVGIVAGQLREIALLRLEGIFV